MHLPHRAGRAVVRALIALCLLALALPLLAHAQALDAAAGAATEGAPSVSGFAAYVAAATSVLFALSEILALIPQRYVQANGVLHALSIYVPRALRYLRSNAQVARLLALALLFGGTLPLAACGGTMSPACEAAIVGLVGSSVTGIGAGISIGLQGQPIKVTLPAEVANAGTNGTTILSAALAAEQLCKGTEPVVTTGALTSAVKAAIAPPALQSVQTPSATP